jgi:hypothetical protein
MGSPDRQTERSRSSERRCTSALTSAHPLVRHCARMHPPECMCENFGRRWAHRHTEEAEAEEVEKVCRADGPRVRVAMMSANGNGAPHPHSMPEAGAVGESKDSEKLMLL